MSAFEVVVTPTSIKNARKVNAIHEPTTVILAPFSAKSVVTFEDIPLSKTARRYLDIHNPSNADLTVLLTKNLKSDINTTFEWTSKVISANGHELMEITWTPNIEISLKDTIQLTDNRNFKKDISIVLKSIDNKSRSKLTISNRKPLSSNATQKNTKAVYVPPKLVKRSKLKSPSPPKQRLTHRAASLKNNVFPIGTSKVQRQSSLSSAAPAISSSRIIQQTTNNDIKIEIKTKREPLSLHNDNVQYKKTIVVCDENIIHYTKESSALKKDMQKRNAIEWKNKENIHRIATNENTPTKSSNASMLFDKLQFTPNFNASVNCKNVLKYDYLATLDTPKSGGDNECMVEIHGIECEDDEFSIVEKATPNNMSSPSISHIVSADNRRKTDDESIVVVTPKNHRKYIELYDMETPKGVPIQKNADDKNNTVNSFMITPAACASIKSDDTTFEPEIASTINRTSLSGIPFGRLQFNVRNLFGEKNCPDNEIQMHVVHQQSEEIITETIVKETIEIVNTKTLIESKIQNEFELQETSTTCDEQPQPKIHDDGSFTIAQHQQPYPLLSVIDEEHSMDIREVGITFSDAFDEPNDCCKTFNITNKSVDKQTPTTSNSPSCSGNANLGLPDNSTTGTPIHKKYKSMRELSNNYDNNLSAEQRALLRMNQGSMPNLHEVSTLKSIDNNRYYYKIDEDDEQEEKQIVTDVLFQETEILAQSSQFNINEITKLKTFTITNEHNITVDEPLKQINNDTKGPLSDAFAPPIKSNNKRKSSVLMPPPPKPITSSANQQLLNLSSSTRISANNLSARSASFSSSSSSVSSTSSLTSQKSSSSTRIANEKNGKINENHKRYVQSFSPPKRSRFNTIDNTTCQSSKVQNDETTANNKGRSFRTSTWGGIKPKKIKPTAFSLARKLVLKQPQPERVFLFDADLHISAGIINPDPFAATITADPFLATTMYLDEESVDRHELQFKKWLNALVTIPEDLNPMNNNQQSINNHQAAANELIGKKIDFGNLFNEIRNKEVTLAPSKESVSSKYLTSTYRMDSLRKAAIKLYTSVEMCSPLQKLNVQIERKLIQIRNDRNLHLDIVLQSEILELLLCINPLWLRIGLEVIYGELIYMQSNSDIVSLSTFIVNRMFRDRYLEEKYTKLFTQSQEYAEHIRKFTLKKFLFLLYFLDVAKIKKIIKYNPCLFVKTSPYKTTRDILLKFSSSLLGNIGDVQKDLKRIGIVLTHKQIYLDEFDYAFRNLAIDLRDGVRLTKIMEIILLRDDELTQKLRCPAISRLQRVHNVDLALVALREAGYVITGNITANDIADGHREKTLSLLWQIIYRFRAPRFHAAAIVLQQWWRNSMLKVIIKRRIQAKLLIKQEKAAIKIQAKFRGYMIRKEFLIHREITIKSCIIIQSWIRRHFTRQKYVNQLNAISKIQKWYRSSIRVREQRLEFLKIKKSTIRIQQWYKRILLIRLINNKVMSLRAIQLHEKLQRNSATVIQQKYRAYQLMKIERKTFLRIRSATIQIQHWVRANQLARRIQNEFIQLRTTTIFIQHKFRANQLMKLQRTEYLQKKCATKMIQQHWRAYHLKRVEQTHYLLIRQSTMKIQMYYRNYRQMVCERETFILQKLATIRIQQRWRATIEMQRERNRFLQLKKATTDIQIRYRANALMKQERQTYLKTYNSIISIQRHYRSLQLMRTHRVAYQTLRKSVILIQLQFRANLKMQHQRTIFLNTKKAIITLQSHIKAYLLMKKHRKEYLLLRSNTILIQRKFRSHLQMISDMTDYQHKRNAIICIQKKLVATLAMRKQLAEYQLLRNNCIIIQQLYRARKQMETQRNEFLILKKNIILIQQKYRALQLMKAQRLMYRRMQAATITLQKYWRATKQMQIDRLAYTRLRMATIKIQQQYRAQTLMKCERTYYLKLTQKTIIVQQIFRANLLMMTEHGQYLCLKQATQVIQRQFRATALMKRQRTYYLKLKLSTIRMQTIYRAKILARSVRQQYLLTLNSTIILQKRLRAQQLMKRKQMEYQQLRMTCIFVQRQFRANRLMIEQRDSFLKLKWATKCIQERYRARLSMKIQMNRYQKLKSSVHIIEKHYQNTMKMRKIRTEFVKLKESALVIQNHWRANKLMQQQRDQFLLIRSSTIKIQRYYRSFKLMRIQREQYIKTRCSIIKIQNYIRANVARNKHRNEYLKLKQITITIQRRVRANQQMKRDQLHYRQILKSTVCIQKYLRATLLARSIRHEYLEKKSIVIKLQRRFHANRQMLEQRTNYHQLRSSTIIIQNYYRSVRLTRYVRNQYLLIRLLIIWVQRKFRAKIERNRYLHLRNTIIFVQQKYRGKKLMIAERKTYLEKQQIIVGLQTCIRGYLARRRYSEKLTPEMLELRKQKKAARVIQSYWRAYAVRRRESGIKLKNIRERVRMLQRSTEPQNTLKMVLQKFVQQLKQPFHVHECTGILIRLEYISRTVPHVLIADSSFIAHFCYGIMAQSIRSEPDKQLIYLCSCIILNMARYEQTKFNTFQRNGLVTIAQMLLRWCDKECLIFNALCTVIWIFSHNEDMKNQIRYFMTTHEAIFMLRETKKLVLRKENMRKNVKPLLNVVVIPQMSEREKRQLPMCEPDYGLPTKKPYIFYSPVFAFDTILKQLNIYSIN